MKYNKAYEEEGNFFDYKEYLNSIREKLTDNIFDFVSNKKKAKQSIITYCRLLFETPISLRYSAILGYLSERDNFYAILRELSVIKTCLNSQCSCELRLFFARMAKKSI